MTKPLKKKKLPPDELRKIYHKADSCFFSYKINRTPIINPYKDGSEEEYFWRSRMKDLSLFFDK